jgi:DNA-binding transcriptional MerR regulator
VAYEENGFLEFLELQGGESELITKSELLGAVRDAGFKLSDRNLTFYLSENLIPRSVRAGSRAGVYPAIVAQLMIWILYMRKVGASIEAIRELLPVWKFLVKSRNGNRLDISELEYVARQHLSLPDALSALPIVVSHVMVKRCCPGCREKIVLIDKNGKTDRSANIGFAIAAPLPVDGTDVDDEHPFVDRWVATTRLSLASTRSPNSDPMTVRLGRKPTDPMPADEDDIPSAHGPDTGPTREEVEI